jgi:hypothetical protein
MRDALPIFDEKHNADWLTAFRALASSAPDVGDEVVVFWEKRVRACGLSLPERHDDVALYALALRTVATDHRDAAVERQARSIAEDCLIWCRRDSLWWRADAKGYTSNLADAGVYTREDAERWARRPTDEVRSLRETLVHIRPGTVGAVLMAEPLDALLLYHQSRTGEGSQ